MRDIRFSTPWIRESGLVSLAEGQVIVNSFAKEHPACKYIGFHTDCFSSGYTASLKEEIRPSLLEIRVFDSSAELRLFRTSLGNDFQYRIADDETLKANLEALNTADLFQKDPEHYRHPVRQILDIDETAPAYRNKEKDGHGCRLLRTVGGGSYALPLDGDEDTAIVIDYLSYDPETGVCSAVDDRIAGFEKWKGGTTDG